MDRMKNMVFKTVQGIIDKSYKDKKEEKINGRRNEVPATPADIKKVLNR